MTRFAHPTILLLVVLFADGCASGPTGTDTGDRSELDRARIALEAFDALTLTEERYGVYVGGQRTGHMIRQRSARGPQLVTTSRIVNDSGDENAPADAGTTLMETFSATAPHDALLLQRKDGGGGDGTRSIRLTPQGYVSEFSINGALLVEPLFDFQYRLADALAPQVWLRSGAAMSQCLTYPGYSFHSFSRNFNTECVARLTTYPIDGVDIDAIETRRRNRTTIVRERGSGRELFNQAGWLGVELRLEPKAIATQQSTPTDTPDAGLVADAATVCSAPAAISARITRRGHGGK